MDDLPGKHAPYRRLVAWRLGVDLAVESFAIAERLPRGRRTILGTQLGRAACAVPALIAEGYGRRTQRDFGHYLRMAQGSLREAETHLIIALRSGLGPLEANVVAGLRLADEVGRCLEGLRKRVESGLASRPGPESGVGPT